jgi:ribosomal protein L37AE/L43A
MKCPACGREHDNETTECPFCKAPTQQPISMPPKTLGICPDCGTEQVGTTYRISRVVADFLKPKYADVFVPDKHQCVRKVAAG